MIRASGITKSFGDEQVLKGIDVELFPGKCNLIIGLSGSGKTVFLKSWMLFSGWAHSAPLQPRGQVGWQADHALHWQTQLRHQVRFLCWQKQALPVHTRSWSGVKIKCKDSWQGTHPITHFRLSPDGTKAWAGCVWARGGPWSSPRTSPTGSRGWAPSSRPAPSSCSMSSS